MGFFNLDTANLLQFFTFPLELLGLTLAAIEIKVPSLRLRISKYVREIAWAKELWGGRRQGVIAKHWQKYPGSKSDLIPNLRYFLTAKEIHLPALKICGLFVVVSLTIQVGVSPIEKWELWWVYTFAIGIPLAYCMPPLFRHSAELIVKFDKNRIVGTVGLSIAAMALLGEGYQFATQIFA